MVAAVVMLVVVGAGPAMAQPPVTVGHSGWFWGDPRPQGEPLNDIRFAGSVGYAVGAFGTVLRTADAGRTWTGEASGVNTRLDQVWVPSASTVIVAGGCVLRRSDDGGRTFARLPWTASEQSCPVGIATIDFPTANNGYLLLQDGNLLRTADGGHSWSRAARPPGPAAASIVFTSPSDGIAAGVGIFRTTDGGRSWASVDQSAFSVAAVSFTGLSPTGPSFLAIAASGAQAYTSVDGGQNWSTKAVTGFFFGGVGKLVCASAANCLATNQTGTLMHTLDGGATFTNVTPPDVSVSAPGWPNGIGPVAVTAQGIPIVSNDSGATFSPVGGRLPGRFFRLRASSATVATLSGPNGSLALTSDGGRSWTAIDTPSSSGIADTSFVNASSGFALDSAGALLRTDDGGSSWQTISSASSKHVLLALDSTHVLIGGVDGIARSRDGGATFTAVLSGSVNELRRAGGALVAAFTNRLYMGTADGAGWRRLALPHGFLTSERISRIDFPSSTVGYLLGSSGRLFTTGDGGRRWRELLTLGRSSIGAIAFTSTNAGWVAEGPDGTSGAVLRTDDGGRTWREQRVSASARINQLAAAGFEGYGLDDLGNLFAVDSAGDLGGASAITLRGPQHAKRGRLTLTGRLSPALGNATVEVSSRAVRGGGWAHHFIAVRGDGSFSITTRIRIQTAFVAHWAGDAAHRAAGSQAVIVASK
jgi:photosystem II stability/assembly factor-like uncharacterized protein